MAVGRIALQCRIDEIFWVIQVLSAAFD